MQTNCYIFYLYLLPPPTHSSPALCNTRQLGSIVVLDACYYFPFSPQVVSCMQLLDLWVSLVPVVLPNSHSKRHTLIFFYMRYSSFSAQFSVPKKGMTVSLMPCCRVWRCALWSGKPCINSSTIVSTCVHSSSSPQKVFRKNSCV